MYYRLKYYQTTVASIVAVKFQVLDMNVKDAVYLRGLNTLPPHEKRSRFGANRLASIYHNYIVAS
jgi:hypothetical protein